MQARVLQEPGSSRGLPDDKQTPWAGVEEVARADSCGIDDCAERNERMQSGYGEATVTEQRRTDQEKSELAGSTGEAGEPDRGDPVEGRRWRM